MVELSEQEWIWGAGGKCVLCGVAGGMCGVGLEGVWV